MAQSAKSSSIMDKLKNSVDNLATGSSDKHAAHEETGDPVKDGAARCKKLLAELQEISRIQANTLNKLDKEFSALSKVKGGGQTDESSK